MDLGLRGVTYDTTESKISFDPFQHVGSTAVVGLWEVAKTLATADADDATPTGHLKELEELWAGLSAVQAQIARRVGWIHEEGAAGLDGSASTKAWLGTRLRLDGLDATRWIQAGTQLARWAASQAAFMAGLMSVDHAAAIASAGADLGEKVMNNGGDLEQLVVDRIVAATGEPAWSVFATLDDELTRIAADADERLAYQSRYAP